MAEMQVIDHKLHISESSILDHSLRFNYKYPFNSLSAELYVRGEPILVRDKV